MPFKPLMNLVATAASIFVMPVVEIDGQALSDGKVGRVATRMREIYLDEMRKAAAEMGARDWKAALEQVKALHPAPGNSLYFVARGDGSHVFSASLDAHNRAVREFQLKRRADYRSSPAPVTAPATDEAIPAASPNTAPEALPQEPAPAPEPDAAAPQNAQ